MSSTAFSQLTTKILVLILLLFLAPRPVQATTTTTVTQVITTVTTPTGAVTIVVPALRVKISGEDSEPSVIGATTQQYSWQGVLLDRASALTAIRQAQSQAELDALAEAIELAVVRGTVDPELGLKLMILTDEAAAGM